MATIHYIRQRDPLGLGHAVSVAEAHVGGEPFAVLLGDDLIHHSMPLLAEMLRVHERYGRSVIAAQEVAREEIRLYGCIEPEFVEENLARVMSIVEKPAPEDAPSNLAAIGRYVLTPEIFDALRDTKPGRGRRDPAHRRDQPARAGAGGVRVHVRSRALRRREQARLPEGDGRARDRARGRRRGLPRYLPDLCATSGSARPVTSLPTPPGRLRAWPRHRHVHDHDDVSGLVSVEEARERVLAQIQPLAPLQLPLTEAYGCVVAQDVVAERDLPEFASSAMDGFAVRSSDVAGATPGARRAADRGQALIGAGPRPRSAAARPCGSRPARRSPPAPTRSCRSRTRAPAARWRVFAGPPAGPARPPRRRGRQGGAGARRRAASGSGRRSWGCSRTPASRTRSSIRGRASSCSPPATS